ncbi:hypothetical protein PHO31112_03273 [Pandoraea horticolens]|uniref:Uncharacterized protein n=1 Tax=Pandoraea horticolens TaxID=2508298 RepID=A0A5E4WJT3_9BURK|nr:hypothetical protein PHO31112_03273 [Pandoraea horticolens]
MSRAFCLAALAVLYIDVICPLQRDAFCEEKDRWKLK